MTRVELMDNWGIKGEDVNGNLEVSSGNRRKFSTTFKDKKFFLCYPFFSCF